MDVRIKLEDRSWDRERHLRHLDDGEWLPMLDPDERVLPGITGKHGVSGGKPDGTRIGADFIRMEPGAKFPLHVHVGDHEIFFISGAGFVHIDGEDIPVRAGHVIHIPGEYAHGVWVGEDALEPLVFVAAGHPHRRVTAADRMRYAEHEGPADDCHDHRAHHHHEHE